jgi:lipopolysaccharide transport system permease protein
MLAETSPTFLRQNSWRYIFRLSFVLGWEDVRGMYRRTILGQFWITLSMLVMAAAISVVFGLLFKIPIDTYLPYLLSGLIFWGLMTSTITEGANAFNFSAPYIQQHAAPKIIYYMRSLWKGILTFAHNFVVIPVVWFFFQDSYSWNMLLFIPGLIVGYIAVASFGLVMAFLATRFRDIPQIMNSVLLVLFYVTPVIWEADRLNSRAVELVISLNPLASILQIMRLPLLNIVPSQQEWFIALAWTLVFVIAAFFTYRKFRSQLAYWI